MSGRPDLPQAAEAARWLRRHLPVGASLTVDSRRVLPGDGFIAYRGRQADGRAFIRSAVEQGARAVLFDPADGFVPPPVSSALQEVENLHALVGEIAADYYKEPSRQLEVVAVTGTNGKTSCSQWIAEGFEAAGRRAAVIGTLGSGRVGQLGPFGLTTPDAVALQRMLARFVSDDVQVVSMEASSIGLEQGRLNACEVAAAVFTNLSHDHLDYHGTMAEYAAAKARLFNQPGLKLAVVNGDDPAALLMLGALESDARSIRRIGFRIAAPGEGPAGRPTGSLASRVALAVDNWLVAEQMVDRADGVSVAIGGDLGRAMVPLRVLGRFNVANVLAVAATWIGLGMPFDEAMRRLAELKPVRGRLEIVNAGELGGRPLVVVDYAHTPDALANVLSTLREQARSRGGRLICVFGAGGDRDPAKRPIMGQMAERLADRVVVTSDNPRSEPPLRIIADIRAGLTREPWLTEGDRARAIAAAISDAAAADLVVIAGKGHETYQEIDGHREPFSDVEHATAALANWRGAAA